MSVKRMTFGVKSRLFVVFSIALVVMVGAVSFRARFRIWSSGDGFKIALL